MEARLPCRAEPWTESWPVARTGLFQARFGIPKFSKNTRTYMGDSDISETSSEPEWQWKHFSSFT
jgi:hypothetical protein